MSLEEWQLALRRQAAEMGSFAISEVDKYKVPEFYKIVSYSYNTVCNDIRYCLELRWKTSWKSFIPLYSLSINTALVLIISLWISP